MRLVKLSWVQNLDKFPYQMNDLNQAPSFLKSEFPHL